MRHLTAVLAVTAGLACAAPLPVRAQSPSQMLQGLLSGNQRQDDALRDAFERGYRQGRQDQGREDRERDRRPPPPRGPYPDRDYDQGAPRNPYGR